MTIQLLKKESKVKGKVCIRTETVAHQAGVYLRFSWREATRSISTVPWWDANPSQG